MQLSLVLMVLMLESTRSASCTRVTGRGHLDVNRISGYIPGKIVFFLMQVSVNSILFLYVIGHFGYAGQCQSKESSPGLNLAFRHSTGNEDLLFMFLSKWEMPIFFLRLLA